MTALDSSIKEKFYHPVIIAPPLSTFAYAKIKGQLDKTFFKSMIEGHLKAIILETDPLLAMSKTAPRVIIPVSSEEAKVYREEYSKIYNIKIEDFDINQIRRAPTKSGSSRLWVRF